MVFQIIAINKEGLTEKGQLQLVADTVLKDGKKVLGEFFHLTDQSVSAVFVSSNMIIG